MSVGVLWIKNLSNILRGSFPHENVFSLISFTQTFLEYDAVASHPPVLLLKHLSHTFFSFATLPCHERTFLTSRNHLKLMMSLHVFDITVMRKPAGRGQRGGGLCTPQWWVMREHETESLGVLTALHIVHREQRTWKLEMHREKSEQRVEGIHNWITAWWGENKHEPFLSCYLHKWRKERRQANKWSSRETNAADPWISFCSVF